MIDFLDKVFNIALWFSIPMAVTYVLFRIFGEKLISMHTK